jgi:hypothetical protein
MAPSRKLSEPELGDGHDGRITVGNPDRLLERLRKFHTDDPAATAEFEVKKKAAA